MADAVVAATPKKAAPKKKSTKAAKPAEHPPFINMVRAAIKGLGDRKGSSRIAIVKYIMKNFKVGTDEKKVNSRVKVALRNGVKSKKVVQVKGVGASGSFKMGEKEAKPKVKKVKKPKSPKKAKKPKSPKKAKKSPKKTAKKPAAAKKPKSPKKATKPKATKPKAAAKPKKAKSPKKAAKPAKK